MAISTSDGVYLVWAACLALLMQAGFAMLEAGSVREGSARQILRKAANAACVGAVAWYLLGMGFAYGGEADNSFIGSNAIQTYDRRAGAGTDEGYDRATWVFQFTLAIAASTIVSGGVAERCSMAGYVLYTLLIVGFVYPVAAHWVWDSAGFLSAFNEDSILGGVLDFAGAGVVHMTGGTLALVAACFVGTRARRPPDYPRTALPSPPRRGSSSSSSSSPRARARRRGCSARRCCGSAGTASTAVDAGSLRGGRHGVTTRAIWRASASPPPSPVSAASAAITAALLAKLSTHAARGGIQSK
jgi:ammonia channel protein AmtB